MSTTSPQPHRSPPPPNEADLARIVDLAQKLLDVSSLAGRGDRLRASAPLPRDETWGVRLQLNHRDPDLPHGLRYAHMGEPVYNFRDEFIPDWRVAQVVHDFVKWRLSDYHRPHSPNPDDTQNPLGAEPA